MAAFVITDAPAGKDSRYAKMEIVVRKKVLVVEYVQTALSVEIQSLNFISRRNWKPPTEEEARQATERELGDVRDELREMAIVIGYETIKAGRRAGHTI